MRFPDFLRLAVMLSAGSATVLAVVAIAGAENDGAATLELLLVGWWFVAAIFGTVIGRRPDTSPSITRLLAGARHEMVLPELRPGRTVINRLWPLVVMTVIAGGVAFLVPQVPGIAAGFAVIWALAWRRQGPAVIAIEDRDGVRFYVARTSPVAPIQLLRTPGFKATRPSMNGATPADAVIDRPA